MVQGVAKNVTNSTINWTVEVDKGSEILRMRIENPTRESEKSLDIVCQGMRSMRSGIRRIPNGFTRNEVSAARRLARLNDGDDIQSVTIKNGGPVEDVPMVVAETADAILSGQPQIAFGGIEGEIISLSARHGLSCTIYDPIQHREVTCYLQSKEAQADAVKGYTKRILASGLIHYAKEGHAVSITVDSMRIFRPDHELPTIEDVQAMFKQYK